MESNIKRYCFDTEVFPNFFCCTFIDIETKKPEIFIIWKDKNEKKELLDFMSNDIFLVSFNGLSYDLPVLRYIREYTGRNLNADLYKLSAKLISDDHRRDADIQTLRYYRGEESFIHQDIATMMNFIKTGVGLKQCSINLKWHRVQDLPLPYDHIVQSKDVSKIVDYNVNDTLITLELYLDPRVKEARELREAIASEYGNEILSAAKSKMADIFFEKRYEEETGIPRREFKELKTIRQAINLSDVILPDIKFKTEKFNNLLSELKKIRLFPYEKYKFNKSVFYKGNEFVMGVGGLHTNEKPAIYRHTDTEEILSMDVGSFYPAIMCEYNIKPEHLQDEFLTILRRVKDERIVAKKAGDKTKAETYKIIVNATFGKLGFDRYWIYDALAMLKVTVNGQLFLFMLIEKMEENGIHCVSGNTDGCELIVPNHLKEKARELAREWEQETKFELEFNNYKLLIKRDVNSYLAVDVNGKKKAKGALVDTVELEKGYMYPIVPIAVNKYFIDGTPVEKTIYESKNIMDFCISKKSDKDFAMELRTVKGVQNLQKTNRFHISNSTGGILQKRRKSDGSVISVIAGINVNIVNDYDKTEDFSNYDLNKVWYIKQAKDLIAEIEPDAVQQSMFNTTLDYGTRTDMLGKEITKKKRLSLPKEITIDEVRDSARRKIAYDVPSTYVLVVDVNTTWSPKIKFYSLLNGNETTFKIKKEIFAESKLSLGDIVVLNDFEERPRYKKVGDKFVPIDGVTEWWLVDYDIATDVADFKRKVY